MDEYEIEPVIKIHFYDLERFYDCHEDKTIKNRGEKYSCSISLAIKCGNHFSSFNFELSRIRSTASEWRKKQNLFPCYESF